ncbi:MAG: YigZ family protein [Bacteroidetes bacterium]|nr:YigZ family protein [Bacteroidota bacterium]
MSETSDTYFSVARKGEAIYREKASKFIGLAFPVGSETEVREILGSIRKRYHDANHHCFAYCLGPLQETYRFNDDGEPSGSAGRPIYGQLLSKSVSDTLVIVVRYFGGTKLGIPGLIQAYRQTASEALDNSGKTEKVILRNLIVTFRYENMNDVMRIQKEEELELVDQNFDNECRLTLAVRKSKVDKVLKRFMRIRNISTSVDTLDQ